MASILNEAATPRSDQRLRPLFIATILAGSFLLFLIQPLFARMILPLLGGSPSVWNVAMVFYQTVLLLGYLYAHALQRFALRTQLIVHLVVLGLASLTLPVTIARWFPAEGTTPPTLWLLGLLAASIGPVFFVVSAQAPLMQAWFARSRDTAAASPFFLYAASNAGSLAALLAYPLILEPTTRLASQSVLWTAGFGVLALLVAISGFGVLRSGEVAVVAAADDSAVTWRQRLRWTLLALVPSGLLLSTTSHLTTDVMAMPLLWVIPLALYLLTFIVAFSGVGPGVTRIACVVAPMLLVVIGGAATFPAGYVSIPLSTLASLILLFAVALALHGTLAETRPVAGRLTEFYLFMSLGGVLGGVCCALVAPVVFDWVYEQPLLLIAAALLIPATAPGPRLERLWADADLGRVLRLLLPLVSLVVLVAVAVVPHVTLATMVPIMGAMIVFALLSIGHRWQFAWHVAVLLLVSGGILELRVSATPDQRVRTFFGIYKVEEQPHARTLAHGTTLHGYQSKIPADRLRPTSYYAPGSGAGLVLRAVPVLFGPAARIGVVGLGTGTLACYAQPGQAWTIFEIDPAIVRIARDTGQFTYLRGCKPDARIVLGDARLSLALTLPGSLDVLAVDAFSSDAIPLHLMTREAFAVYGRVLAPNGVLLVHVSNRYLQLEPVVAAIARAEGWSAALHHLFPTAADTARGDTKSTWIALTRSPARMAEVQAATDTANWRPLLPEAGVPAWSDDFASILPVIKAFRPAEVQPKPN
ncbi:fused MFS/spermidine synthase [Sphingosinicellaceae bacterium]|nr:fused MFS/spermidine synthase [Sphingosinicellaceae bacterium]